MKKALLLAVLAVATLGITSCSKTKKLAKQHNDLQDTYEMLKQDMAEAQVSMEGEKVRVVLPEAVLFTINSAELNKEYLPIMGKMATVLNKYPKTSILITGYTDATGTDDYNLGLSKKRAENAKTVLIQNKINASRIFIWGQGSKNPVADNKTVEGRKQNRRVEYVIMYDYKAEK